MLSVALRVKTISRTDGAFRSPRTFSREASSASVARSASSYTPRWTFAYDVS